MLKKLFLGILATVFLLSATPYAFAKRDGYGPCFVCASLSKEQLEKLNSLREKFRTETESLRREISQKRLELRKMYTDPKVSESEIREKQRELSSLMDKLREKKMDFRLEQRKVLTPEQLSKLSEAKMTRFCKGKRMGL